MFRSLSTLFLATGLTAAGSLFATLQDTPGRATPEVRSTSAEAEADKVLATMLVVGSKLEVEVGQIAQRSAQDPEIQQFAQRMVEDHRQLTDKLQRFAAPTNIAGGGAGADPGVPREAGTPRSQSAGHFDHVALIEELGEKHLETARNFLQEKQGEKFDRCFVGMAVASHMTAVDKMEVFQKHASSELKSTIQEGHRMVKQHLERAKELAKKMEGEEMRQR